mmetsp:Transcript_22997/g.35534  ORF Transcript_22997/g.35534 Transcript_22997/m.35534 type:complete len:93 (-) Transcript_22997:443-721(-)
MKPPTEEKKDDHDCCSSCYCTFDKQNLQLEIHNDKLLVQNDKTFYVLSYRQDAEWVVFKISYLFAKTQYNFSFDNIASSLIIIPKPKEGKAR